MGERKIDPRQQFSKWLARWTSIFWFAYMTYLTTICFMAPPVSDAMVYLAIIASCIMMLNVGNYTKNSIYEKVILASIEKKKLDLKWRPLQNEEDTDTDDDEGSDG